MSQDEGTEIKRLPRIYLNGFPKSGLHLALLMARSIVGEPAFLPGWAGNFVADGWSTEHTLLEGTMGRLRLLRDDTWLRGHMGYEPVVEQYLYWHGAAVGFIYRDLRDVLVSQSYHVTSDNEDWHHPGKGMFKAMDRESCLMACLCGIGPYPGLFERWALYAPWLGVNWVFKLRYEDMMQRREETARAFLRYVWERTTWGYADPEPPVETEDKMTAIILRNMERKEYSGTFRKGGSGGWREEFTPRVKDEFKQRAGDWLIRLGYEKDNDW